MEAATPPVQSATVNYGNDDVFDLEIGMTVFDPTGQNIGHVIEIAGFGSTHLGAAPLQGPDDRVTQAQTSTGYFKVKRAEVSGAESPDLCIPFHAIRDVTTGHDVVLNSTIKPELSQYSNQTGPSTPKVTMTLRGRWQRWLASRKA
jgi:hypothetical protein